MTTSDSRPDPQRPRRYTPQQEERTHRRAECSTRVRTAPAHECRPISARSRGSGAAPGGVSWGLCRAGVRTLAHQDSPGLCPAGSLQVFPILTTLTARPRGRGQGRGQGGQECRPPRGGREELRSGPQALQEEVQTVLHRGKADFQANLLLMVAITEARISVPCVPLEPGGSHWVPDTWLPRGYLKAAVSLMRRRFAAL